MSVFFFAGRDCYPVRFDRRKDHTLDNYLNGSAHVYSVIVFPIAPRGQSKG